ncbi:MULTISPECIES: alanine racemase [Maricaulis]|uniref:Alanine racemase n=1 Tax=Maricaulis maris TaxID=74318 RepID=A0A495D1X8_9PROT|nr:MULTISPECIES: alanine racemase [Maricaulis]RKQ95552.1 alanine racemase [Maricaulis maris]
MTTLRPDLATPDGLARPAPRLIIDLAAIQRNYAKLQALAPTAEVGAVVKANAYALGATEIIPALAEVGCRQFYTAHTAEGVEARQALAGRAAAIYVFNGFWPSELPTLRAHGLIPVVNTLDQLASLRATAPDLPCALHLDTGMNRLGLGRMETEHLLTHRDLLDGLDVRQIMSHLACADAPAHPLNAAQLERFSTIRAAFPDIPASLANSAGALLGQAWHFDVLRPGLALYGGTPAPGHPSPFEATVRIDAPILQIRELEAGDTLGYGATWTAERPMRVATIAAGYADGLLWASAKGGAGHVGPVRTPILGRVSMDLIAVDLTDVKTPLEPGMPVSFLGEHLDDIAEAAGTISYEFLVRLGIRFDRVYQS